VHLLLLVAEEFQLVMKLFEHLSFLLLVSLRRQLFLHLVYLHPPEPPERFESLGLMEVGAWNLTEVEFVEHFQEDR
jgi:hypothetical protein